MSTNWTESVALRVAIIDDHEVLRAGLKVTLEPKGIVVVGEADCGADAQTMIQQTKPDVAIVDMHLPDVDGCDVVKQINRMHTRVVVYTAYGDQRLLYRAMTCGASAFVLKHDASEHLATAIKTVSQGQTWLSPSLREGFIGSLMNSRFPLLSPREREILGGLSRGQSTDQVATDLTLSAHTVRTHVKNAMRKLDASTRAHAVAIAMRDLSIR